MQGKKKPRLVINRVPEPPRATKGMYMQKTHAEAFDRLAFEQKLAGGKKAPALIEEAIEMLCKKYGVTVQSQQEG